MEMMERVTAKQRQRDEEIERRLQEDREAARETVSSWRKADRERGERGSGEKERERGGERERERPVDKPKEEPASSWRKGGAGGATATTAATTAAAATEQDAPPPKKAEAWRSSIYFLNILRNFSLL